jgi:hypothetical protein
MSKVIEFVIEITQGCRVVSHTDSVGQGIERSANAPKAMPVRSGTNSAYQNKVEPQLGHSNRTRHINNAKVRLGVTSDKTHVEQASPLLP